MKTTTYLRLSLLIPFLVWGVSILFFMFLSLLNPTGSALMDFNSVFTLIIWAILFYAFGIIVWIFPYFLVSLVLLIWSFRSRAQALIKVFALSPLVMAILVMIIVNLLLPGGENQDISSYAQTGNLEGFFASNLWFVFLALGWGYICVGVGWGFYKLLQMLGMIRDGTDHKPVLLVHAPA
jgi:hypothetical protein